MTVSNQSSTVTYTGNGLTAEWPYTFPIPDADYVKVGLFVIATGILTELDPSDYSISGIGESAGGEVTYPLVGSPLADTHRIVIWRELPYTQDTELTDQTPYYPTVLEDQLDRIVMQQQQLAEEVGRSFKVTQGSTATPDELVEQLTEAAGQASEDAASAAASAGAASTSETNAAASATAADTSADEAAASAAALALAAVDIGTQLPMDCDYIPPGFLRYGEGGTYNTATYPAFTTWMGTNHPELAAGDLPDYRDYVPRTAGGALGPAVGETQEDAMQRITGQIVDGWANIPSTTDSNGAITISGARTGSAGTGSANTLATFSFDSGDSPDARVSDDETRVKSFGVRWIIKAYNAPIDLGTLDVVALEQALTHLENNAVRGDVDQTAQTDGWQSQARENISAAKAWNELAPVSTSGLDVVLFAALPDDITDLELWFNGVSVNSTDHILVQFGVGGIPITTGYMSASAVAGTNVRVNSTSGFALYSNAATYAYMGVMQFHRTTENTWVSSHCIAMGGNDPSITGGGQIALAGMLDYLRIRSLGGVQTFDAGSIQVRYR